MQLLLSPPPQPSAWRLGEVFRPAQRASGAPSQGVTPLGLYGPGSSWVATYNGGEQAESVPNPSKGEWVCLVPYLIRGLGFPVHPFLRGLLEFYGLQLHNLTPASILHIAGFVALCELFLGIEAHFALCKRLFCLVPRS